MSYEIKWAGTPNFREGRGGRKPLAIVDHITAGQYPGTLTWMQNPRAQASAHYLVTRRGEILQLVKDEDTAWANGIANKPSWKLYDSSNPNRYTLSIEHEGYREFGGDGNLSEEQYAATLWLHRHLLQKWQISIDEDHIIGHYRIDSVNRPNCPGPKFPWERLFQDLRSGGERISTDVKLAVNGQMMSERSLRIRDGVSEALLAGQWVPLREIAGLLGAEISWDSGDRTVRINMPGA